MSEPDYTKIRDDRIRGVICDLMSEMLDNPDEHGIYPTSKFTWKMETFILAEIAGLREILCTCPPNGPVDDCRIHGLAQVMLEEDRQAEALEPEEGGDA